MIANYEIVKDLKPIYIGETNSLVSVQILKNKDTNNVFLYDTTNQRKLTEEYTELLPIEVDSENLFLLVNDNGKCGIYDVTSESFAYPPIYDSARFISNDDSVQKADGKTFMCVLELFRNSGLFTFTKKDGKIIDRSSLIPVDNYDDIQTNLFSESRNAISMVNGIKTASNHTQRMLFVEVAKGKDKGCFVIKNNTTISANGENLGGEFETILEIPIKYTKLRPSEFSGDDGYSNGEYYEADDVYLYESTKNFIGDKSGVYSPIQKHIVLNDSLVIQSLNKGLLLHGTEYDQYGVLLHGVPVVPAKFSPQIILEETEEDEEPVYKFWLASKDGFIFEYKSTINNWNKNLVISKYNMNEEMGKASRNMDEFFNNLFGKSDGESQK